MKSKLVQANHLMSRGYYSDALNIYNEFAEQIPDLANIVNINIQIAKKRVKKNIEGGFESIGLEPPVGIDLLNFKTIGVNDIQRQPGGSYISLSEDPYFIIDPATVNLNQNNWYVLKLKSSFSNELAVSKIYFDKGFGFNEIDTLTLPIGNDLQSERVFFVDKYISLLRYDPIDFHGEFKVLLFNFEKIDEQDAKYIMLNRICENIEEFSDFTEEALWEELNQRTIGGGNNTFKLLSEIYKDTFTVKRDCVAYEDWIEYVEKPSLPTNDQVSVEVRGMLHRPVISVIIPVYNTPENYLRACIDSVIAQSYPNWELCIADDNSPNIQVRKILEEYQNKDQRIRLIFRTSNGHISEASNTALKLASGDYVALLDHDDQLSSHALYFMAQAINVHPQAQILYSDEDKIDIKGNRFDPHFKCDWNPDLFYSQNYISHLGVYKRDLLMRIEGFRLGLEGSQDQDLLLRCLPHVQEKNIVHLPHVLYHWRTVEGSTALAANEKGYTTEAGIRALRDYFAMCNKNAVQVEAGELPNTYRVHWPIPEEPALVSLLIPTRDRKSITEIAVCSILDKTTYPNYEILILDNGSVEPETLAWFSSIQKKDSRVKVLRYDYPFNFSAINNFGVKHASGKIIGLVNNDVEVINPEWLTEMVSHAHRPEIGCVGAKLYYSDGRIQHAGVILGIGGIAGHSHKYFSRSHYGYFSRLKLVQSLSAVTAACLIVRKEIYLEVDGLDESELTVAFNDVDFCLKVREAGYRNLWTPYAELYHHESVSRGFEDSPDKQRRFAMEVDVMKKRWSTQLNSDPYYSRNLTLEHEDFSMRLK